MSPQTNGDLWVTKMLVIFNYLTRMETTSYINLWLEKDHFECLKMRSKRKFLVKQKSHKRDFPGGPSG